MSTTQAQRIAVRAAREALAECPDYRDNTEPLYWVGRLKAATELLLDAYAPDVAWETARSRPAETVPVPEPLACVKCGMADAHLVAVQNLEPRCHNHERCAERAAARDAEAAQVTL